LDGVEAPNEDPKRQNLTCQNSIEVKPEYDFEESEDRYQLEDGDVIPLKYDERKKSSNKDIQKGGTFSIPKKRRVIGFELKKKILDAANNGIKSKELVKNFNLPASTISEILKQSTKMRSFFLICWIH
jgi:hypothetical protein